MPFFRRPVVRRGSGKGRFDRVEQGLLVAFDLLDIVAAFLDDMAGGEALVVERVGGDDLAVESRQLFEQALSRF